MPRLHIQLGGSTVAPYQKRISDNEFEVSLPQTVRGTSVSLLQFQMLNLIANVHSDNNRFYYFHAGLSKVAVIPQNAYSITTLIAKLNEVLTLQSGLTVTHAVVDNAIQLTFSQIIRFEDGTDSLWKRLGFSPDTNTSFTVGKTVHIANKIFNLSQSPTIFAQITNTSLQGDLIQSQHFAIPNLSAFGGWVSFVADKSGDQQTVVADHVQTFQKMKFRLYDYDGHALHVGFDDHADVPLVMVLDIK